MKVISDYWDWNLTRNQKLMVAWAFGALGVIAMLCFSFPNTLLFFLKVIDFDSPIPYLAAIIAVSLAIFVNGLEMAGLYLLIWKIKSISSAIVSGLIILTCAFFSVVGTFGSFETSDQVSQAKLDNVGLLKAETANIQTSINEKNRLLTINNDQIAAIQSAGRNASTFLYTRSLTLTGQIDSLNSELKSRAAAVAGANLAAPVQVFNPEMKRRFNYLIAPVIEILMLLCSAISILSYKEIQENESQNPVKIGHFPGHVKRPQITPSPVPAHAVGFNLGSGVRDAGQKSVNVDRKLSHISDTDSDAVQASQVDIDSDAVQVSDVNAYLTQIYQENFRGKSDAFILYCFDHFGRLSRNNFSYGNLAGLVNPILPKRKKISRQYCHRVIKRERSTDSDQEGGQNG